MFKKELKIHMLGNFSIQCGENQIGYEDNRAHKIWLLLAYLIYCRKRVVTTEEICNLLWSESDAHFNTKSALKTTLHRVRSCLEQLYSGAGHELIVYRAGTYAWNTEIPLHLDVEEFDGLCKDGGASAGNEEQRLSLYMRALNLYQGDFLPKLSAFPWVVPISVYFHKVYIQTVTQVLLLLEKQARWEDICEVCHRAQQQEPYNESICRSFMSALFKLGKKQDAIRIYEWTSERLLSVFGIMPSDETRTLYLRIIRTDNGYVLTPDDVLESLRESEESSGTMICGYDFFRIIYQSTKRLIGRTGSPANLVLITIMGQFQKEISSRSLNRAMENLLEVIRTTLRRSDVAAKCSASQVVVLLPGADYENSKKVWRTPF